MPRRRKTTKTEPIHPRIPVPDREVRIGEWPLLRGQIVRRRERQSATLGGVTVGSRVGKVEDIYRREEDGPVFVDFRGDAKRDCGNLFTARLEDLKWSEAKVATEYVR